MGFALVGLGVSLAKNVNLKTPADKRAAAVVGGVVQAALAGNMLAVKVLDERRAIGVQAERKVWQDGYAKVAANGRILEQYALAKAALPALDHSGPEAAAAQALGYQASYQPNVAEQAFAPVLRVAQANEAAARDAVAQAIERVGVGGGAALARKVRGAPGPLDDLIGLAQTRPAVFYGALVAVVVLLAVVLRRR